MADVEYEDDGRYWGNLFFERYSDGRYGLAVVVGDRKHKKDEEDKDKPQPTIRWTPDQVQQAWNDIPLNKQLLEKGAALKPVWEDLK
jgi:hypothetical protein